MKYVRLTLRFDAAVRHPAQDLIDSHDAVERDMLLHGNTASEGWDTFVFYVEGKREPYREMLESAPEVVEYELTDDEGEGFYAYLKQEGSDLDESLFGLFSQTGLVLVPPVEFLDGGRARLTVLGDPEVLRSLLTAFPDGVSATVDGVGEYDGDAAWFDAGLTTRQYEALAAAVELGYYETPSAASLDEVAAELGCSSGTAGEHLRKAERAVLTEFVSGGSFAPPVGNG